MSTRRALWLISSALVAGWLAAARPWPAWAQPDASETGAAQPQPPTVVGRIAFTQGTVSFHTADQPQWQPATLNYPLTSGDALWTEPQALAEIQVAASAVWLSGGTELDVNTLDERTMATTEPQGELYLHLRNLPEGQSYTVTTPRGVVTLATDGRYDIVAGDTGNPTTVTVVEGAAQVSGNNLALQIGPNQTATINGTETFQSSIGALAQDAFLASMEAREQQRTAALKASAGSPPAVVSGMTGYQSLQGYGTWQSSPQYGAVWYPQVGTDWTPYEDGTWDYVAPWGWTWVSAAPWGFAPFHYGRWADFDGRWAWVPGAYSAGAGRGLPVYAPALVTFFSRGGGELGWVPLAPGEPYFPPYRADERYLRALNRFDVREAAALRREERHEEAGLDRFANRRAAIVVPATVVTDSRLVREAAHRLGEDRLAEAHPLIGREPLKPTLATIGVTPRIAREQRLEGETRRVALAPGPRIEALERGGPAGHAEHRLPGLRQANIPATPPATELRRGGEAERHPAETLSGGLPTLRAPNARPGGPVAGVPGQPPGIPVPNERELRREERHGGIPGQPPTAPGTPVLPPHHEALVEPGPHPGAPPAVVQPATPPVITPRFAPRAVPHERAAPIFVRPVAPPVHVAPPHVAPPAPRFAPPPPHFAPPPARFVPPAPHFAPPAIHVAAPAPRLPPAPRGKPPPRKEHF